MIVSEISPLLREFIAAHNLTYQQVANMLGVCRSTISGWVNATSIPSGANLLAVLKMLDINDYSKVELSKPNTNNERNGNKPPKKQAIKQHARSKRRNRQKEDDNK